MSWSYQGVGHPRAVLADIADQKKKWGMLQEPEQSIRDGVFAAIELSLKDTADVPVKVTSSGSMGSSTYDPKTGNWSGPYVHSLNVQVEPLWGFLEKPEDKKAQPDESPSTGDMPGAEGDKGQDEQQIGLDDI